MIILSKSQSLKIQRNIKFIVVFLFVSLHLSSQVMISDSLFLSALIEYDVDTNQDGQIQLGEAEAITTLELEYKDIYCLSGIEAFINLTRIKIGHTHIDSVDLTKNTKLTSINLADNNLREIQILGLLHVKELVLRNNGLSSVGISNFTKLEELDLRSNSIDFIDLVGLPKLEYLNLTYNSVKTINFSETPNLVHLALSNNPISELEIKHLKDLTGLVLHNCKLTTLDISGLKKLFSLWITSSPIKTLFMKGTSPDQTQLQFDNTPLKFICADQSYLPKIYNELGNENITDCLVTTLCPFSSVIQGGISGKVKIAESAQDCDSSTNYLAYPKLLMEYLDPFGQHEGVLIGAEDGSYNINFIGTTTLRPALTYAPQWEHVVPEFSGSNYTSLIQYHIQDFCMVPIEEELKTQLHIIPLQEFRAGYESTLNLLVRNTGTKSFSGTLSLHFPEDSLTYVSANYDPSLIEAELIQWKVDDLLPFDELKVETTVRLNSPMDSPPLNANDHIQLCVELTDGDQYHLNTCVEDIVVNSFDPNDKTYLGRDTVTIDRIQELDKLIYLIRFENNGSADAKNILISDPLDNTFILPSSIEIVDASHNIEFEMRDDNVANFKFPNINLPFDVDSNNGYVLFSVESRKENISINDEINNSADIYFDFNFPIITNEATIWIVEDVNSSPATTIDLNSIKIFPNPSTGNLTIESKTDQNRIKTIEWINPNGKIQRVDTINSQNFKVSEIDLAPGIYSIRITTEKFVQMHKVIIYGT